MTRFKNTFSKICSSSLVFFIKKIFYEDRNEFRLWKLTKKSEIAPFLTAGLQFLVQDIKVSLEYVDFYAKMFVIFYATFGNKKVSGS